MPSNPAANASHRLRVPAVFCSGVLALSLALSAGGCSSASKSTTRAQMPSMRPAAGDVEWWSYNGNPAATRYSTLSQVNTVNAPGLRRAFTCELGETCGFESSPVIAGGRLVVTTGSNTYAFDAANGTLLWKFAFDAQPNELSKNIGVPNRGVAFDPAQGGRFFRTTNNGHVLALDAETGALAWDTLAGDPGKGEYMAMAPVVWSGIVFTATAGSDIGSIGRVIALDAISGAVKWNWAVVPSSGPGSETWPPDKPRAGGGMYSSFAIDEDSGLLYVPTGNPGPDFLPQYRPGDNLYTCSVVMLDARSGAFRGHQQFVRNDGHDWNMAAPPALITTKAGEPMVIAAGKNGMLYGLDRQLDSRKYEVPVVPRFNEGATLTKAGTRFAPGTNGGVNWNGPAFSPRTNLIYVPAIDWPTTIKITDENPPHKPGQVWTGTKDFGTPDAQRRGFVVAFDADTGREAWRHETSLPQVGAVTPTAGGVVFTGTLDGAFVVLDAASGKVVLTQSIGKPVGGGVSTYSLAGKQYVAVAAGLDSKSWKTSGGNAQVVVFTLE